MGFIPWDTPNDFGMLKSYKSCGHQKVTSVEIFS